MKPPFDPIRDLTKILTSIAHRKSSIHQVFADFVEMAALALSNRYDLSQFERRELRYLEIARQYDRAEMHQLCEALGLVAMAIHRTGRCAFEQLFTYLELGNKWRGQVFSPWHVSELLARMTITREDVAERIAQHGFVTMADPCCGAGSMLLASAQVIEDAGYDYRKCLHVTAQDIDRRCVAMAYIQFTVMGLNAHVIEGDTLRLTSTDQWFTSGHLIGAWAGRLHPDRLAAALASDDPEIVEGARLMQRIIAGDATAQLDDITITATANEIIAPSAPLWRPPVTEFVMPRII